LKPPSLNLGDSLSETNTISESTASQPKDPDVQPAIPIEPNESQEKSKKAQMRFQPVDFEFETSTVWSFRSRGAWATHSSDYRGNWSPLVVRNLILRYTTERETVLDPFVGGGTTMIETKLLNRNGIGLDINEEAVKLTIEKLDFEFPNQLAGITQTVKVGDARDLNEIENNSIDLVLLHPPYADVIQYTKDPRDLSMIHDIKLYLQAMRPIADGVFRVLKPGRYCALLIGDTRRFRHYVPIAFPLMEVFLLSGFILKENIIKHQWNCKSTPFWREKSVQNNFLLLAHEHLFVFRKPVIEEDTRKFRESMV
jgi:methylase of polypeptide subunit release factors